MACKRGSSKKRRITDAAGDRPRKRNKTAPAPAHPHGDVDYDVDYKVRSIIGETKTKYHIDWEPNTDTGEEYTPTWEPKANANQLAIDDWEEKKAALKKQSANPKPVASSSVSGTPVSTKKGKLKKVRARKVIESSSPAPEESAPRPRGRPETSAVDADTAAVETVNPPPAASEPELEPEPEAEAEAENEPAPEPESTNSALEPGPEQQLEAPASDAATVGTVPPPVASNSEPERESEPAPGSELEPAAREPEPEPAASAPDSEPESEREPEPEAVPESAPAAIAPAPVPQPEPAISEPEPELDPELEIAESQHSQNSEASAESTRFISSGQKTPARKGFVVTSSPSSSYLAGQYQKFGSRPASRNGVESPRPASPRTAGTSVLSTAADLRSTGKAEAEQAPVASVPETSTQRSIEIPESQSQSRIPELPEDPTFRGFSPTQRTEAPSSNQAGEAEVSEGAFNELAVDASQQVQSDCLSLAQGPKDCAPQATQPSIAAVAISTESDEQAVEGSKDCAPEATQPSTASIAISTELGEQASLLYSGQTQIETNTQGAEQISSVAEKDASDTGPAQTQTSPNAGSISQDPGEKEPIVISSTEHQSGQSASLNFDSSVHETDYELPPAGQRPPPPSSAVGDSSDDPVGHGVGHGAITQADSRVCSPPELIPSQAPPQPQPRSIHYYGPSSSFPFQTQLPRPFTPETKTKPSPAQSPSILSAQLPDSTPFPSIPSHSLVVGESAPRPISLSPGAQHSKMDSPQRETLTEKLKRHREERTARRQSATPVPSIASSTAHGHISSSQPASALPANLIAEVAVAQAARLGSPLSLHERSPSTVPAVEAVAPITREEMITSGRYETLLPQAHDPASGEAELENGTSTSDGSKKSQDAAEDSKDPETASIHVVPVAPSAHQRDQYQTSIYYDQALIREVLAAQALEGDLLARASKFLQGLRDVAMHPDLVNIETLSQTADSDIQARWDVKCSAKFCFLNELISNLSDQNLHIAVAAQGQRVPNMLQKFLEGINVPYKRWARPLSIDPDLSPANLGLKVSIIDLDGGPQNVEPADVVVAMDPSADTEHPLIRAARKNANSEGVVKWTMLLVLVIPRTIEHVERCLQADMSPETRAKVLVKATNELRFEAGRLESTQAPLVEAASAIAGHMEDTSADWPIAGLSQLDELDSQTETEIQFESNKRPLDETQDDAAAAKRARLAAAQFPGTIDPLEMDLTHVSDSLGKGTDATSSRQSVSATEQRLHELLRGLQIKHDEHVRALEALQYRHEDQRKVLVEVRKERDAAILTAQTATSRMTGAEANNAALRIERTELKEALADANRRLLSHANPEVRELQAVRLQVEQARAEQERALRKAAAAEKDLDWTRSMYQDSSNRARELAQSNAELETRLTHATHVARGEQARAREASYQGHNKLLEQENKRQKQMLENMKLALKNKDEQISSIRRGRIGTRQSSVPRSPRMGSPMKGGRLSRQTSPVAAEARGRSGHLHPLRNSG